MLIISKQRQKSLGFFKRISGVNFDITINFPPQFLQAAINFLCFFLRILGKKYCFTKLDECFFHSNNNNNLGILK